MSVIGGRGKEKDEEEKLSHPFDMGYEDFSQIKSLFPQFQQRRTVRATGVAKGVDLQTFILKLKEKMNLPTKAIVKILKRLDNKKDDQIDWNEFLQFLNNEGQTREIINNARLYGVGSQRLKYFKNIQINCPNYSTKNEDKLKTNYIESMKLIDFANIPMFLISFQNKKVFLFNGKTLHPTYEFSFSSKYGEASKHLRKRVERERAAEESQKGTRPHSVVGGNRSKGTNKSIGNTGQHSLYDLGGGIRKSIGRREKKGTPWSEEGIKQEGSSNSKYINPSSPNASFAQGDDTRERARSNKKYALFEHRQKERLHPFKFNVLGINPLEDEDMKTRVTKKNIRSWGLDDALFTPDKEREENERKFKGKLREIKANLEEDPPLLHQPTTGSMSYINTQNIQKIQGHKNTTGNNPKNIETPFRTPGVTISRLEVKKVEKGKETSDFFVNEMMNKLRGNLENLANNLSRLSDVNDSFIIDPVNGVRQKKGVRNRAMQVETEKPIPMQKKIPKPLLRGSNEISPGSSPSNANTKQSKYKSQKNKKRVFIMATCFDKETNTLGLALIDSEIIIYKMQIIAGTMNIEKALSFMSNEIVTALDVALDPVSNKLILLFGTAGGIMKVYQLEKKRIGKLITQHPVGNCELTHIKYVKDMGIIVTSFNGTVHVYDTIRYNMQKWESSSKSRKFGMTITILCYSYAHTLMCIGGKEGRIAIIDPYAKAMIEGVQGHSQEIQNLYFYDSQMQLISISVDKYIKVWDIHRLECLQRISPEEWPINKGMMDKNLPVSASMFTRWNGGIYTIRGNCAEIWRGQTDPQVELKALQLRAFAKAGVSVNTDIDLAVVTRPFKRATEGDAYVIIGDMEGGKIERNYAYEQQVKKIYIDALSTRKIQQEASALTTANNVLISKTSSLLIVLFSETSRELVTIDSDNLVRVWKLATGLSNLSYSLDLEKRITTGGLNAGGNRLVVCNEFGKIKVFNTNSGGTLFTLPHTAIELHSIKFMPSPSEFWIMACGAHGKTLFWPNPEGLGVTTSSVDICTKCCIGHRKEVLCVSMSSPYLATGGSDGFLTIWNSFGCTFKYTLTFPLTNSPAPSPNKQESTSAVRNKKKSMFFFKNRSTISGSKRDILSTLGSQVHPPQSSNSICALQFLNTHWIHRPHHQLLAVSDSVGVIHLVDVTKGEIIRPFLREGGPSFTSPHFAYDGQGKMLILGGTSGIAVLLDVGAPELEWEVVRDNWTAHLLEEPQFVSGVLCCKKMNIFLTASSNGEIKLWDKEGEHLGFMGQSKWPYTLLRDLSRPTDTHPETDVFEAISDKAILNEIEGDMDMDKAALSHLIEDKRKHLLRSNSIHMTMLVPETENQAKKRQQLGLQRRGSLYVQYQADSPIDKSSLLRGQSQFP